MSSREHPLFTIKNNCQDCYKCVRQCPVKAIKIEDNSAQIVPELCVACGQCYKVCPVRAKQDRDDVARAKNLNEFQNPSTSIYKLIELLKTDK
jgi:ferredoxin